MALQFETVISTSSVSITGLCIDHDGSYVVVDSNDKMWTLATSGRVISVADAPIAAVRDIVDRYTLVSDRESRLVLKYSRPLYVAPHPRGICRDSDGTLLVTCGAYTDTDWSMGKHRVVRFSPDGEQLLQENSNDFNNPCGVAVLPDSRVLVADMLNNRVCVLSSELELLSTIDGFNNPCHVCVSGSTIIVCDRDNNRVQFFDNNCVLIGELTDISRPEKVMVDLAGRIVVASVNRLSVHTSPVSL